MTSEITDLYDEVAGMEIKRYQLDSGWSALNAPRSGANDWGLLFPHEAFTILFDETFPSLDATAWRKTSGGAFGCFLKEPTTREISFVQRFINKTLRHTVVIADRSGYSLAMDFHQTVDGGELKRTELGELIHAAKPYDGEPTEEHKEAARKLAHRIAGFIREHSCLDDCDAIVGVPSSNPDKAFKLPSLLAAEVAELLELEDLSEFVRKVRATPQLKNLSRFDKASALRNSISVGDELSGRSVIVLDDLYQSGTTLNIVAGLAMEAGATKARCVAVVKTLRNDDNTARSEDGR